jgi:hypothetical protein
MIMARTSAEREEARQEFDHAVLRVGSLLFKTAHESGDHPVLNMISKHWNRGSGTHTVQILVVIRKTGELVDISTEVATILGLRYSQMRRGVLIRAINTNAHHHIATSLAVALYGQRRSDDLTYRSH